MSGAANSQDSENERPSLEYGRLRSWYLATLRKRIVNKMETGSLTPSMRVSADREAIFNLVAGAAVRNHVTTETKLPEACPEKKLIGAIVLLPISCIIPVAWMLIAWREAIPLTMFFSILAASFLGAVFSVVVLVVLHRQVGAEIERYIQSRLSCTTTAASLSSSKLSKIDSLDQTIKMLCDRVLQAEERENAIADYALDIFCALDDTGRFCAASPSSSEFFGLQPSELKGRYFCDFIHHIDLEKTQRTIATMAKASGGIPFETRIKHPSGKIIDIAWHAEWSRNERVSFCIGKDVSSQRRLERLRNEFVSMVGHDLKTPITSIDCTLELLANKGLDGEQRLIENARQSIGDLLKLINQILELERMEDGKLPISKRETELMALLNRSVNSVVSYAQRENVRIELAPTDLFVNADPEKLQQVVINLLANAIKFSPKNTSVLVNVAVQDASEARVSISDSGPGIAAEYQAEIFERFQQVSAADRSRGSGLGLSIARTIVHSHGGSIGVNSAPGQGSTFWFTVPLAVPLPKP